MAVEDRTDWAIATLREHLGVVSRSEMRTNRDALQAFKELKERFIEETSGL